MELSGHKLFYLGWIGGLTFLAGAINICAILLIGSTITHYTGNVSNAAIALANNDLSHFGSYFSIILLFFIGSAFSGYLIHEADPGVQKSYFWLPIAFGGLTILIYGVTKSQATMLAWFALGMGAQNGTSLRVRGVLVRTTHMTGYLTDAAVCMGKTLHGHQEDRWKLPFYLLSALWFFAGGVLSTYLFKLMGTRMVLVLGGLYIFLGVYLKLGFAAGIYQEDATVETSSEGLREQPGFLLAWNKLTGHRSSH